MIVSFGQESLEQCAAALAQGTLVAFPTETVYGLGARADSSAAVRSIYVVKGRPPQNPCIVHVAHPAAALDLAAEVPPLAHALASKLWPGPLTLVLRAKPNRVAPEVMAGGETLAVRVPSHPVARALLDRVGVPIAAPSANRSTTISPTSAAHVEKSLGQDVLILDGGPADFGIESTIVDVASASPAILRHGSISRAQLAELAPNIVDHAITADAHAGPLRAPGLTARHYAPRHPLVVMPSSSLAVCLGAATAFVVWSDAALPANAAVVTRMPSDASGYGRELYATLHTLEDAPVAAIVVEAPPNAPGWEAVRDRLKRASHPPAAQS